MESKSFSATRREYAVEKGRPTSRCLAKLKSAGSRGPPANSTDVTKGRFPIALYLNSAGVSESDFEVGTYVTLAVTWRCASKCSRVALTSSGRLPFNGTWPSYNGTSARIARSISSGVNQTKLSNVQDIVFV